MDVLLTPLRCRELILREAARERVTDVAECSVKAGSQLLECGGCAECHESYYQGVFDKVLSIFTDPKRLQSDEEIEHEIIHSLTPLTFSMLTLYSYWLN